MVRVILAISICPAIGLICDFIMRYWKNYENGSREVQYPVPALITFVTVSISLAWSLFGTNIWPTLTFIGLKMGLIYTFE